MATKIWRKLAILVKPEETEGVDIVPAAADAMVATNVTFTPIEGEEVDRALMLPYMGNQGVVLAGTYGRLEMDIEIAGSGTPGTAPKYAPLLRASGLAETLDAGESATYSIVEDGQESVSIYFNMDGVRHVLVGARGNISLTFQPKTIPKFRVTLTGMLGTITDVALPAVAMAGWVTPVPVSKADTTMSLHGWPSVAESLSIDLGNTVTARFLIGDERIIITDRKTTGTAVVEARSLSEIDWFAKARNRDRGELTLIHGTTAGNIVEVTGPALEVGKPTLGQTDGIANYSLPLSFCPVLGRDELLITIK